MEKKKVLNFSLLVLVLLLLLLYDVWLNKCDLVFVLCRVN